MPGNLVVINNYYEFYVGDSRIGELLEYLGEIGIQEKPEPKKSSSASYLSGAAKRLNLTEKRKKSRKVMNKYLETNSCVK
ncbi:hypothetical protein LCGC14_0664080 [marine sediment metagenome]|uniref:Uncharacterized protein n=1 Tax=marine sediment metagenome TaxID=412755 RepID=A0A0F9U104_9ZZZZ